MNDIVRARLVSPPPPLPAQTALAVVVLALATALRVALDPWLGEGVAYVTYFPALILCTLAAGIGAGVIFLILSPLAAALFILGPPDPTQIEAGDMAGLIAYLTSAALILWLCRQLTRTVRQLDAAHRQERLLVLELQHRVKNTLTVVQSLASQTFTTRPDPAAFREAFSERLIALGRAHNALSITGWRDVPMLELVRAALMPFDAGDLTTFDIGGEEFRLSAGLVVDTALCLNELATNAAKYGALSRRGGRVIVRWNKVAENRVQLTWTERGGPPASPPSRRGFGARLLERGMSRGARPDVRAFYDVEGLRWSITFDARPEESAD